MAIQAKGIPYFALDCTLDTKFELIEAEFGLKGFAVVVKLFQRIYGIQGYYCEWDSEVELLFSKQINEGRSFVSEVVNQAVNRDIFDRYQFEQNGILTSKGIQERFFQAAKRRQKVEIEKSYLILSDDEIPDNVCIINQDVDISKKNVYSGEQRKGEESKEEKSRGEESKELDRLFDVFWKAYPKKIGKLKAKSSFEKIKPDEHLLNLMVMKIDEYKSTKQWQEDNGKYIPHPATWLNQGRWEDEINLPVKPMTEQERIMSL